MQLSEAAQPVFARHETFHPRYGWFRKAYVAASRDPYVFASEDAPVRLGVGKNMVRSIRFWGLAAKVVTEVPDPEAASNRKPNIIVPTRFGEALFGDGGWDPWMEDPGTLWLLHWRMLAQPCRLPVWWLALCDFNAVEFELEDLGRTVMTQLRAVPDWKEPSESAVQKDLSAFMRTYAPAVRVGRETLDDAADCPLRELRLVGRSEATGAHRYKLGGLYRVLAIDVTPPCDHGPMANSAPGKHYRKGMTLIEFFQRFPDNAAAERYLVEARWPDGPRCPHDGCDSANVQIVKSRKPQPFRCRTCRKHFSVRTNTPMHASNLGLQTWLLAMYLMVTGIKGTSSMKLHRDLGVTYRTAWHLSHRIREAWADQESLSFFDGPVEIDETYVGGKARNMHARDRERRITGRGGVDKAAVVGAKDRATGKVSAEVVAAVDAKTLRSFVDARAADGVPVFTDGATAYRGRANHHAVLHSLGEYVRGEVHTNGIESLWSMLKRGYVGTYHKMSDKHLHRYVAEFAGRHNMRPEHTENQIVSTVAAMNGKRLPYAMLVADAPAGTVVEPDRSEPW